MAERRAEVSFGSKIVTPAFVLGNAAGALEHTVR